MILLGPCNSQRRDDPPVHNWLAMGGMARIAVRAKRWRLDCRSRIHRQLALVRLLWFR